jgi:hypothetical protein
MVSLSGRQNIAALKLSREGPATRPGRVRSRLCYQYPGIFNAPGSGVTPGAAISGSLISIKNPSASSWPWSSPFLLRTKRETI